MTSLYEVLKVRHDLIAEDIMAVLWGRKTLKPPVPTEFFILNVSKLGIGKLK